jgi:hypothetical protein
MNAEPSIIPAPFYPKTPGWTLVEHYSVRQSKTGQKKGPNAIGRWDLPRNGLVEAGTRAPQIEDADIGKEVSPETDRSGTRGGGESSGRGSDTEATGVE